MTKVWKNNRALGDTTGIIPDVQWATFDNAALGAINFIVYNGQSAVRSWLETGEIDNGIYSHLEQEANLYLGSTWCLTRTCGSAKRASRAVPDPGQPPVRLPTAGADGSGGP